MFIDLFIESWIVYLDCYWAIPVHVRREFVSVAGVFSIAHCLDLDLNGQKTRRNF